MKTTCPPCTHTCRQGRDCQAHQPDALRTLETWAAACLIAALLSGGDALIEMIASWIGM